MNIYNNFQDITKWSKANPYEAHYFKYETNIIFACHNIVDVYQTMSIARSNLDYLEDEYFEDFFRSSTSFSFIKSILLQNALIYYNTCISLSWQVLWLYLDYNLEGKLPENKLYYKSIKKCNFNELLYRLTLAKEIKLRDYYVKGFLENPLVKDIRQKYNYLKHRGTYYFSFLGLNDSSSMMFSIDNKTIPMISRISVDTEKWKKQLIDFDKLFEEYFSEIVRTVVPKNFSNTTFGLKEPVAYYNKHKEEIDKM